MQVEYELTPEDYAAAAVRYEASSASGRRARKQQWFVVTVGVLGGLLLCGWEEYRSYRADSTAPWDLTRLLTTAIPLALVLTAVAYLMRPGARIAETRRGIREAFGALRADGVTSWHSPFSLAISERGLDAAHNGTDSHTQWGRITIVDETDAHILILSDPGTGWIIPKRAFPDAAAAQAFLALARQYHQAAQAGAAKPGV